MSWQDIEVFHSTNTDDSVREYLWDNEIISMATSLGILQRVESLFAAEKWGLWKILRKKDERYLGYAGLWRFFEEPQPQLLYALRPEFTGNGFAAEAAAEVVNYAFKELGYTHLCASMDKGNEKSAGLCKKIGMRFEKESIENGKATHFYKRENS